MKHAYSSLSVKVTLREKQSGRASKEVGGFWKILEPT